jgi:hypothetical protein
MLKGELSKNENKNYRKSIEEENNEVLADEQLLSQF